MRLRIRKCNDVDITKTFSASIRGGGRGYGDMNALETFSNDLFPCVKTLNGFTVLVEVDSTKRYASIHPIHRKMEWNGKKNKMGWLSEDIAPTLVLNGCRGDVIWEVDET